MYLTEIYFNVSTMITVGYGDVTASSIDEVLIDINVIIFVCGTFPVILGKVNSILYKTN